MPLPDFFVIGAPKSGTTALYRALARHPEVFMSPIKEPAFFAFAGRRSGFAGPPGAPLRRIVTDPREYLGLFTAVRGERAIGEATTAYLGSVSACEGIRRNVPDARLIVFLRDPVARAYSSYWSWVAAGVEPEPSFEAALADESAGLRAGWWPALEHRAAGFYGAQLGRYVKLFGHDRIQVHLHDDWCQRPRETLAEVLRFIGVDANLVPEVPQSNMTVVPRWPWARRLARRARCLVAAEQRLNRRAPPEMLASTRASLEASYRSDLLGLEELIGRDLSPWLGRHGTL